MKYVFLFLGILAAVSLSGEASAEYAAQKDAAYLATIKAVADYKINDEEEIKNVNALRENVAFNQKLQKMLNKLSNDRTKNTKNRRVYEVLKKAGKEIYDILE
jgi:hypothetical protein